ncbi:MAG TPA: hypothetical protein VF533_13015 [Solirubrobacteraceae bacterium]|jgi:class 3 adenylate cyclase
MPETVTATFVFADIAGFTALTEAHGDEAAAELVGEYEMAAACFFCSLHCAGRFARHPERFV